MSEVTPVSKARVTDGNSSHDPTRVAFYLPDLSGGGAERVVLTLCEELHSRGFDIELVVDRLRGEHVAHLPRKVPVQELLGGVADRVLALARSSLSPVTFARDGIALRKPYFALTRISALANYFARRRPTVVVTALGYTPFIAERAAALVAYPPAIIHVEHNTPSRAFLADNLPLRRLLRLNDAKEIVRATYPKLDAIVAVSHGVASDTADFAFLARSCVRTIYNPIAVEKIRGLSREPASHPWLVERDFPLLLTAGRLVAQKNFPLLFKAFSQMLTEPTAHLIVLGDGPLSSELSALAIKLGVADRIDLAGWQDNPYAFMAACDVFIQSSDREGLSTVLIEALACGCKVVATDCPSGPREILDEGRFGTIVPMHDASALAVAIEQAIQNRSHDRQRVVDRASEFSVERAVDAYEALVDEVAPKRAEKRRNQCP